MKLVIPCAGESSRLNYIPKYLVRFGNKSLLAHIVDSWKDSIDNPIFVIKQSATYLLEHLPENSIVVFQNKPKGLADAILRAEVCVEGRFIINLGDCLFAGIFEKKDFDLGIGVWRTDNLAELNKSYLVETKKDLITKVVEKPNITEEGIYNCGLGIYFLDSRVFNYLRRMKAIPGGGDFTMVLQDMIDAGEKISPIWFEGEYINLTSPEDVKRAGEILDER